MVFQSRDFVWENSTLNLRRKYKVSIKTNTINEFFRVENIHIPNLILIDFYMVVLSVVKNGDFVWEKGTFNLCRKHKVSIKTNTINEFFRVENIHIPNLILIDFYVVVLSVVKNGDFG